MEPIVTILIVSYNTVQLTVDCISSVYRETTRSTFELIVADNGSADGSVHAIKSRFPLVRIMEFNGNMGFAPAINAAAATARGEYFLLLNPDTQVLGGAIDQVVAFADAHDAYGVFGVSQFLPDGTRNTDACWARPTPWSLLMAGTGLSSVFRRSRRLNPESYQWWSWSEAREVDIVSGSFLLIRAALWRTLRGFNPDFFMYGEDADLCLRAREGGFRCVMFPQARIIHYGGASERNRASKLIRLFAAKQRLLTLHWRPVAAVFGVAMLKLWACTRWLALSCVQPFSIGVRTSRSTWMQVWRARKRWAAGEWS